MLTYVKKEIAMEEFLQRMRLFFRERDWEKYHSPKNLAMCLSVEVAEVLEHFQWLTEEQSSHLDSKTFLEVKDEIGDVFINLLHLADQLGINPLEAAKEKLVKIGEKYPVHQCKGKSTKYTTYVKDTKNIN